MPSKRPRLRFQDILDNIAAIRRHTESLDQQAFEEDELVVDAVERCLSRISEAAIKLGDAAKTLAPGPEWAQIRGLGNILRHDYPIVNLETLWEIVNDDLGELEDACNTALTKLPTDDDMEN